MPVITSFRGAYAFLSNFYIEPDGTHVEGEYQRSKCILTDPVRKSFINLTPADAKRLGRRVKLRAGWDGMRLRIMKTLVRAKFTDHPKLFDKLLASGDATLIEGNNWNDTFWGAVQNADGEWVGENHLGKILMEVRDELGESVSKARSSS